jgi:hypothetical protein
VEVTAAQEGQHGARLVATLAVLVSLAGVACALTLVFLSMRSVMNVGGFCAEGGPYDIRQHCPQGITGILPASIVGGLLLAGIYAFALGWWNIPGFVTLLWSALFLSLGWNFFQYAIDPPGTSKGVVGGWLVCGIVFALMGGLPLIIFARATARAFLQAEDPEPAFSDIPIVYATGHEAAAADAKHKEAQSAVMSGAARVYWLCVQLGAIGAGIWGGVGLFDWAAG